MRLRGQIIAAPAATRGRFNVPLLRKKMVTSTRRERSRALSWPVVGMPCRSCPQGRDGGRVIRALYYPRSAPRSEEHTSELQSRGHLVCRLLLEKKNTKYTLTYLT